MYNMQAVINAMCARARCAVDRLESASQLVLDALAAQSRTLRAAARLRSRRCLKLLSDFAHCADVNALYLRAAAQCVASMPAAACVMTPPSSSFVTIVFEAIQSDFGTVYSNGVDVKRTARRIYEPPMLYAIGDTAPALHNNTFEIEPVDAHGRCLPWLQAEDIDIRCDEAPGVVNTRGVLQADDAYRITLLVHDADFADDLRLRLYVTGVFVYAWTSSRLFDFCANAHVGAHPPVAHYSVTPGSTTFDVHANGIVFVVSVAHGVCLYALLEGELSLWNQNLIHNAFHAAFSENALMVGVRQCGVQEFGLQEVMACWRPPAHTYACEDVRCFDVRGTVLALGKGNGTIDVYDTTTRECVRSLDPRVGVGIYRLRVMPNKTHVIFVPAYMSSFTEAMVVRLDGQAYCNVLTLRPFDARGQACAQLRCIAVTEQYQLITTRLNGSVYVHGSDPTLDGVQVLPPAASASWVTYCAGKMWILYQDRVYVYE